VTGLLPDGASFRVATALVAVVLFLAAVPGSAVASGDAAPGASVASVTHYKKKCKKGSKKKPKKCKGKRPAAQKPWSGSPYRPGQVCSLAPEMQKKYKRYGLFCLDLGLGIWTLEPL
jgi:hypothetical protein